MNPFFHLRSLVAVTFACFAASPMALQASAESTLYIARHFEVRDQEQPVKYVYYEDTRVARAAGSLSSNPRVQRLRLHAGWNLCSLAVSATNFLAQADAPSGTITSALQWDPAALSWETVAVNQALSAGTILWVQSTANTVVPITGEYTEPGNKVLSASGDFLPAAGLEAWDFKRALSGYPTASAVMHQPASVHWRSRLPAPLDQQSDFPSALPPGSAVFVRCETPAVIAAPDSELRIRYYHQDHLGSSSVVTDDNGALVEETAFFPFGEMRHEFQPRQIADPYKFTQKERDRESRLNYFEARYQSPSLSRFMAPDMKYKNLDMLSSDDLSNFLSNPQKMNLYAYVLNNPVKLVDPRGLDDKKPGKRVLIAYTRDMFEDARTRMGIPTRKDYHAALRAAYAQESGANAQVVVQNLESYKDLTKVMAGSSYDVVIVDTHAYGNDKALFMGEDKTYSEINVDGLEKAFKGAKTVPKEIFFYGCNTGGQNGLAADLSGRFPDTEVTGASSVIQQTVDKKYHDNKPTIYTIHENRDHNRTFKKGAMTKDARTVNVKDVTNAELPRP